MYTTMHINDYMQLYRTCSVVLYCLLDTQCNIFPKIKMSSESPKDNIKNYLYLLPFYINIVLLTF